MQDSYHTHDRIFKTQILACPPIICILCLCIGFCVCVFGNYPLTMGRIHPSRTDLGTFWIFVDRFFKIICCENISPSVCLFDVRQSCKNKKIKHTT